MKASWMYLACLTLGGCQLLLDVDSSQCERDADCVGLLGRGFMCGSNGICKRAPQKPASDADAGAMLAARWSCLDEEPATPPPLGSGDEVEVKFDVLDFTTLEPPEGLEVRACAPTDVACSDPLADGVEPDAEGFVTFELPYAFEGYYQLDAPGFLPALSYSNRALTEDAQFPGPLLVSPDALRDLASFGGESIDEKLGTVVLEVLDCDGGPGDGVALSMQDDAEQHPFYFEGALPDRQLNATVVTTALGRERAPRAVGGFSNVKPNYVTFEARLRKPERMVATFAASIRAGSITFIRLQAGY